MKILQWKVKKKIFLNAGKVHLFGPEAFSAEVTTRHVVVMASCGNCSYQTRGNGSRHLAWPEINGQS